jgi:hypothetical protein
MRDGAVTLKGSHRMGDGPIFLKTSASHSLMKSFQMNLLSARSIALDSTFKYQELFGACKKVKERFIALFV